MNGFLGTYSVNMDEKGRLNVPSKFKAILEKSYDSNLVVAVMDNFLIAFPQKEWQINEERLNNLASECELKSGKILVPQFQREIAGLNKEVVLVGMSKTFEIWAGDRWNKS